MTIGDSCPTLSISVDRAKCCGYTLCAAEAPEVYSIDDQGFVVVAADVPASLEDQARRGADSCPDSAIVVHGLLESTKP